MSVARNVLGIAGWSGTGKTSLIVRLIPELTRRGYRVATVKHAHHDFDIDTPGKDSYEHREAGAVEVAISSAQRWAILHDNGPAPEPSLEQILARMSPADLYLVEGYKSAPHPKIEIHRETLKRDMICTGNPSVVAVATDAATDPAVVRLGLPLLPLDDVAAVADFIVAYCGLDTPLRGAL
jgi:molybdopterin-guanine dinucleotide biosynthesis protein B